MVTKEETKLSRGDFLADLSDVVVLWSLAVAQPLYSLLSGQPEFFVARGAGFTAMSSFALVLSFVLPLLFFGLKCLLYQVPRLSRAVHLLTVAGLITLLIFPAVKRSLKAGSLTYFLACLMLGLLIAALYLHYRRRALSLVVFLPVVPLLALLFLFSPSIRGLLQPEGDDLSSYPKVSAEAPIVFVVFDEFPVISIMKEDMGIDHGRYPNFAELAKRATWFRNASTVAESTAHGLPAILDGLYPNPDRRLHANAQGHPHSLFTLLGGSYRFNVVENTTQVCPQTLRTRVPFRGASLKSWFSDLTVVYLHIVLPSRFASSLPDISHSWKGYGADKLLPLNDLDDPKYVFEEFLKRIEPSHSTLNFVHFRLPHFPWLYLPSGRRYCPPETEIRGTVGTNDVGEDAARWTSDDAAVLQGHQRHLLQVGMADWLLGKLIRRLQELGIYDDCLLVVTADHGTSFRVNDSRRVVTATNYPEIAAVPLFIKAPNQAEGTVDDRNIETVDILPTVAGVLDIQLPWKVDGVSAENRAIPERKAKYLIADRGIKHEFDPRLSAKTDALRQQCERFRTGDWKDVFRVGLPHELTQKPASELASGGMRLPIVYEVTDDAVFRNFDPTADILTTVIRGKLNRPIPSNFVPLRLIISVNDRIVASTQSYLEDNSEKFFAVASDSDFTRGPNHVEVFTLGDPAGPSILERLERRAGPEYRSGTKLTFGASGTAVPYLAGGWSFAENDFRWNDGKQASLALSMPAPDSPVMLTAEVGGFIMPGKIPQQRLRVLVDQEPVGEWVIHHRDFRERSVLLEPANFKNPANVVVRFEAPDAVSPFAAGVGRDIRQLAFAIKSLTLSESKEQGVYRWGQTIEFGTRGNSSGYQKAGWSSPEEGINWNDGVQSELFIHVPPPHAPVLLKIFAKPFILPGKVDSQRLRIIVNNRLVGELRLSQPQFQDVVFEIPASVFHGFAATIVQLETPDAKSPRELGAGSDERRLGIAVRTVQLSLKGQ